MNRLKKMSLGLLIIGTISGCSSLEAKYCSKDCKDKASTTNTSMSDESMGMMKENNINSDGMEINFNSEEPLVCLLTGPEQSERKEALQKKIFSQVKKVEEMKTGYLFYFKYDENFLMKMTDYVIAENNCCPFLTFVIKLHSKDDVLQLAINTSAFDFSLFIWCEITAFSKSSPVYSGLKSYPEYCLPSRS